MAKENLDLVTFKLITSNPTSYAREDGSFVDQPVGRRVMGEFTVPDEKGKPIRYRHIKNAHSLLINEQEEANEIYNYQRDDIYFTNGLCVLHPLRDRNTIDILRKSPQNIEMDDIIRPMGVQPVFAELKREEEGASELDKLFVENQAVSIVMGLQSKSDEGYTYNINKINFLSHIFKLDGDLEPSERVIALVDKAKANPSLFIYQIENDHNKFKSVIEQATELKVIEIIKGTVSFPGIQKVVTTLDDVKKGKEIDSLIEFFSNPQNEEDYKTLIELIKDAKEAKPL